jgi:hypothetical protein
MHLEKLLLIALPKELGDWGLKDILPFAQALDRKNIWRITQGNSLRFM